MINCIESDPRGEIWRPRFKDLVIGELFKRQDSNEICLKIRINSYMWIRNGSTFTGAIDLDEQITVYEGQLNYWPKRI